MTNLITRITTWLNTAWAFLKRNWAIIVPPTVVVITLGLAAVAATTTLTRCGCQGPVLTPTPTVYPTVPPTVTVSPSPTPVWEPPATPTPQPSASVITGTNALEWDMMYNVSPVALTWGWDENCHLVVVDDASERTYETACGETAYHYTASYAYPYAVDRQVTTCISELVYRYVVDVEVRQNGEVVRAITHVMALAGMAALEGTPMPTTGQYDGDLPWEISTAGATGQFEVWVRGRWVADDCDELPIFVTYKAGDDGLVPRDERGFSLAGVYER